MNEFKTKGLNIYREYQKTGDKELYDARSNELYYEYLFTDEWKRKAMKRREIDGNRCVICDSVGTRTNPLQVHHMDYRHIYDENIETDLVTLCKDCHANAHKMLNRITNTATGRRGWKDTVNVSMVVQSLNRQRHKNQDHTERPLEAERGPT